MSYEENFSGTLSKRTINTTSLLLLLHTTPHEKSIFVYLCLLKVFFREICDFTKIIPKKRRKTKRQWLWWWCGHCVFCYRLHTYLNSTPARSLIESTPKKRQKGDFHIQKSPQHTWTYTAPNTKCYDFEDWRDQ